MSKIRIAMAAGFAVAAVLAGGAGGHYMQPSHAAQSHTAPSHASLTSVPMVSRGPVLCCDE